MTLQQLNARIHDLLIGIDMAAATVLFTTGNDITISSRAGMALLDSKYGVYDPSGPHGIEQWALDALAAGLDDLEKEHCFQSIYGDQTRWINVATTLMPYVRKLDEMGVKPT